MARVPITIMVEPAVATQMERRAATMSLSVQDYAGRLMAAGYAARVGIERGMPSTDAELDAAVRAVFALAGDANTRTIAKVTGLAKSLVENILRGFKTVAAERQAAALAACREPEEAAPVQAAPDPVAAKPESRKAGKAEGRASVGKRNARSYTPQEIEIIRKRYFAGDRIRVIAAALGRTRGALDQFLSTHRDEFPRRQGAA